MTNTSGNGHVYLCGHTIQILSPLVCYFVHGTFKHAYDTCNMHIPIL